MKSFLDKPYPLTTDHKSLLISALAFGVFVFSFLYVFRPFGLSNFSGWIFGITLGYGAVTTISMLFMSFVVRRSFPAYFNEDKWNNGKEVMNTMAIVFLVALGNMLYSNYVGFFSLSFYMLVVFLGITLSVGIFPVLIQVLLRQNALQSKYNTASESINKGIQDSIINPDPRAIVLHDEDGREVLTCAVDELIAMESADNYVKIYLSVNGSEKNLMVRNALGKYESELSTFDHFMRTHRTFLINLDKIEHVEGNARGYNIKLKGLAKTIPVARRRIDAFDQAMSSR
jgi:hypothetical protein